MKAIKIGTNTQAKTIHELRNNHAQKTFNSALEFMKDNDMEVKDMDTFRQGFVNYARERIKAHEVLKHLDTSNLIQWSTLYKLEQIYHEYFEPTELIDYDIYATTDTQIEAYKYAKKLKELLNEHPLIRSNFHVPLLIKQGYSFEIDPQAILMLK
jgi:hypothetical protein